MNLPRRGTRKRMGLRESGVIRCDSHLQWTRGCVCAVAERVELEIDQCEGKMHAHHVRTRGAGGGDEQVVALCSTHHGELHNRGVQTFEKKYGVNLTETAAKGWLVSPHGIRYRREHGK